MKLVKCPVCKNPVPKRTEGCVLCGSKFSKFQYFKMNYLGKVIIFVIVVCLAVYFSAVIYQNNEIQKYLEHVPNDIEVVEKLEKNYDKLTPLQKKLVRKKDIDTIKKSMIEETNREVVENVEMLIYFEDGMKEGVYTGQTSNGVPNGQGRFEFYGNDMLTYSYEGDFSKGTIDGNGTMVVEGGLTKKVGTFKNGVINGVASIYQKDENSGEYILIYKGEFVNDTKHGKGILYNNNGSKIYEGTFYHGLPDRKEYEQICLPVVYDDLYNEMNDFQFQNVAITGLVTEIDIDRNLDVTYIITPKNSYGHYIFMNNIGEHKELTIGSSVALYGFCTGIVEHSNRNGNIMSGIGIDVFYIR